MGRLSFAIMKRLTVSPHEHRYFLLLGLPICAVHPRPGQVSNQAAVFRSTHCRFGLSQIGWWLLEVYFGLDASGFENARELPNCWPAQALML